MKLKNKNVLVYGLGISGSATINFLLKKQAKVFLHDDNKEVFENFNNQKITKFELSKHLNKIELVLVAPGVYNSDYIKLFETLKVNIINEIELASYFVKKSKIIAITGTNGKTTTTKLVEKMLICAGKKATACGNVGVSFLDNLDSDEKDHFFVVEISTFQLERIKHFKPDISVVLNITPDHLDRHKDFFEYQNLKFNISRKQNKKDFFILNSNLEKMLKNYKNKLKAKVLFFGTEKSSIYIKNEKIVLFDKQYIGLKDLKISSNAILDNYYATILIGDLLKIEKEVVIKAIKEFMPEKHRIEDIGTFQKVKYINDSKATNPSSTIFALKMINKKDVILLLGGYYKNLDLKEIFKFSHLFKYVICFGQARKYALKAGKQSDFENICETDTLLSAVKKSKELAKSGDIVLLSPACASFDEFKNYKERGELFKRFVNAEYKNSK